MKRSWGVALLLFLFLFVLNPFAQARMIGRDGSVLIMDDPGTPPL